MRIPLGYTYTSTIPNIRAGAIYIEVENTSAISPISIRFEGVDPSVNDIILNPGQKRIFPFLGSQGYAAFQLTNTLGGNIDTAFVLIIN